MLALARLSRRLLALRTKPAGLAEGTVLGEGPALAARRGRAGRAGLLPRALLLSGQHHGRDASRLGPARACPRDHAGERTRALAAFDDPLRERPRSVIGLDGAADARVLRDRLVRRILRRRDGGERIEETLLAGGLDGVGGGHGVHAPAHARTLQQPRHAIEHDRRDEHGALALATCASGPAAAVRVRIGIHRRLGMEHARHVLHVDAARRDVGGDERMQVAALERRERLVPFALLHLAGERVDDEPGLREEVRELADVGARARKDQRGRVGGLEEQVHDGVEALVRLHEVDEVLDVGVRGAGGGAFDARGIGLHAVGERHDLARERRRHEVRAMVFRREADDGLEVVAEPEVEHAIGLVEHDGGELRSVDGAALEMIEEPTRRADDDGRPGAERASLVAVVAAAGDGSDLHAQRRVEPRELDLHLGGELARRRDDERAGAGCALRRGAGVTLDGLANDEPDRERLARAGLRADPEITPDVRGVEDRLLNGRERGVALLRDRARELGSQERFEIDLCHDPPSVAVRCRGVRKNRNDIEVCLPLTCRSRHGAPLTATA